METTYEEHEEEREPVPDLIYELVDVVEQGTQDTEETIPEGASKDEVLKTVSETAERVAREMFPDIAERIIREEIEKLKKKLLEEK
jgi:uncharacterized protein YmfQ (DUF2313 family)